MAANVLETVSEELGTTGVIESRHSIMGNKGILLYEFSQNFKPEHIYNIAFEYVSERIAECNVSGNEQTDEKNNELRHIFVELGMVDSYLDCSPETVQYRQDSEITEKYRISGNAEMPLCWQKVKQELPGKILNLLIRQKYIQLKSDQRLVGQNTIITTTGIELNIPFATRRSESSSPRAASDLLTRLRGQRDPQKESTNGFNGTTTCCTIWRWGVVVNHHYKI